MTQYLLDTNIISDVVRRPEGRVGIRVGGMHEDDIFTSVIVAAELRYWAAKGTAQVYADRIETLLQTLNVVAFYPPADVEYGRLRALLGVRREVIGANDLLIAAHALSLGAILVTDNRREFDRVPGLIVENWLRD